MDSYEKFALLMKISRPIFWIAPPLVFLGWLYSGGGSLSLYSLLQLLSLSIPYCLLLFGINDIYDHDSDRINPRKGGVEGLKLEKKNHKLIYTYVLISGLIMLIVSMLTSNILNVLFTLLLIIVSYYYSAEPVRLKEIPIIDSLSNGLGFFLVGLVGLTYTRSLEIFFIKAIYLSLGVSAIHAIATIVDYDSDNISKTQTFATYFGKRVPAFYAFLVFVVILLFSGISSSIIRLYILCCAIISLVIVLWPKKRLVSVLSKAIFVLFIVMMAWYLSSINFLNLLPVP